MDPRYCCTYIPRGIVCGVEEADRAVQCARCGWNPAEEARRRALPFVTLEDGRQGKLLPRDPFRHKREE